MSGQHHPRKVNKTNQKNDDNSIPTTSKNNTKQHQQQITVFTRANNNRDIEEEEKVENEKIVNENKSEAQPKFQLNVKISKAETLINKKAKPIKKPLKSEPFNLKRFLELKKMEREKKIGTLPPTLPPEKPISVASTDNSSNSGVAIQTLPSPIKQMEDYGMRQFDTEERLHTAAEQKFSKLGVETVREDVIGPQLR